MTDISCFPMLEENGTPANPMYDYSTLKAYSESYCHNRCYRGWADIFECTDPNSWSSIGIGVGMGFSILGSGSGMLIAGSSINAPSVKAPRINA